MKQGKSLFIICSTECKGMEQEWSQRCSWEAGMDIYYVGEIRLYMGGGYGKYGC